MVAVAEPTYTVESIDRLLYRFEELDSRSEGRTVPVYGPTLPQSRGLIHDRRSWSAVRADLELAHEELGPGTLSHRIISMRMRGLWLRTIASTMEKRYENVIGIYWGSVNRMHRFLEDT